MSYNNPFMISRHLNPRASGLIVFGGGGGGDPAPAPATPAPVAQAPAPVFNSSYPELSRNEYSSAEEMAAAERTVDSTKTNEGKLTTFKSAIDAAASQAGGESVDKIGQLGLALQAVQAVAIPTFEGEAAVVSSFTEKATAHKTSKVESVNAGLAAAQGQRSAELASGAREKTGTAITDPGSLATKADVANIDPNAAGTNIAQGTGQLSSGNSFPFMRQPRPEVSLPYVSDGGGGEVLTSINGGFSDQSLPMFGQPDYKMTASTAGPAATAEAPAEISATGVTAATGQPAITEAMEGAAPAQGEVSAEAVAEAATTDPTKTGVMGLDAAKGTATVLDNPVQREIQAGELISGVADAAKAAAFTEQIQAATATPSDKATVKGQLTELMQDFEGGDTPAWAAGAMRNATAQMAARGLGSSSMAGQAIVQAAMESALPIAMQDAQTTAGFEMQNLSNRQQRAMLGAQQRAQFIGMEFDQAFQARVQNSARIADVANMNFTAEQSIALENSRNANTMDLANLSNSQAMVMAQAASISQLESQNLSNQQQAAVQNAQAFLQMDMANLNNRQQTEMFKTQTIAQSILTDQAAENAARQFNASSENQTKQFMANMQTQLNQFNSSQINSTNQFNAGQENAAKQFNANIENQRDQFNAQNALVVAQANAQWKQNTATLNTAAQNEANSNAALAANAFTQSTMDQLWQRERDIMDYVYKASESSKDRSLSIILADKKYEDYEKTRADNEETGKWSTLTQILLS
jgi:hypothetical protein